MLDVVKARARQARYRSKHLQERRAGQAAWYRKYYAALSPLKRMQLELRRTLHKSNRRLTELEKESS